MFFKRSLRMFTILVIAIWVTPADSSKDTDDLKCMYSFIEVQ